MESEAGLSYGIPRRFRGVLGAAALPQSENHVGQQQCVAFILRHTIFHKRAFSQINVTTRRRSTSSTGASRELCAKESGLSRSLFVALPQADISHFMRQFSPNSPGFSPAKATLDTKSGVTNWRLHGLRRTMATGLQRLGVRLEVTEQVLNHVSGSRAGIVGVYQRHEFASEKRAALDAWGAHVLAVVEGRAAMGNVVTLRESA